MEQRNDMLKQMRLTNRQKKGDVQHLLARSFSRKAISMDTMSPCKDITMSVPQLYHSSSPPVQEETKIDQVSIGDLSIEPRLIGTSVDDDSTLVDRGSPLPYGAAQGVTTSPLGVTLSPQGVTTPPQGEKLSTVQFAVDIHPSPLSEVTKKEHKDSLSDSDSDSDSDKSVHTPLLETKSSVSASTLPTNSAGIQKYDEMFGAKAMEDEGEVPLVGSSAEDLLNQPWVHTLSSFLLYMHSWQSILVLYLWKNIYVNNAKKQQKLVKLLMPDYQGSH